MSVPAHCWRMVYGGALPQGEVWQTGYWLQGNEPASNDEAQAAAQVEFDTEGNNTPSSVWNAIKAFLGANVTMQWVKVYSYPLGGTQAQFIGQSTGTAHVGTGTGVNLPNQVAAVASLLTGQAGRSFRGRMYWPAPTSVNIANGLWANPFMVQLAQSLATKFTDGNVASGFGKAVVVSQTRTLATQISTVRVDSRPDVQRRRGNKTSGITSVTSPVTL